MTNKEYLDLISEFSLVYDNGTSSCYYKEYPVCGYRLESSCFPKCNWHNKSLIIFENYSNKLTSNGKYTGFYNGKYSDNVDGARKLIAEQIEFIKKIYYTKKFKNLSEDF